MRSIFTTTTAVLAAGALAVGCGDDTSNTANDSSTTSSQQASTAPKEVDTRTDFDRDLARLLGAPQQFAGKTITVTGEVEGATSAPAAFTVIRPRGAASNGIAVLPTASATTARDLVTGQQVTVSGTVMKVTDDLATRGDFLFESDDNASNTLDRVESKYVIAADSVKTA